MHVSIYITSYISKFAWAKSVRVWKKKLRMVFSIPKANMLSLHRTQYNLPINYLVNWKKNILYFLVGHSNPETIINHPPKIEGKKSNKV